MPALACADCGRPLLGESFCGPPRDWFHTEGVMSVVAHRAGWSEGLCPTCQKEDDRER